MSRSLRKTPIYPITSCKSEKLDKKSWHRCWRSKEHARLTNTSIEELDGYLTLLEDEVCNLWSMGKDGHRYWPIRSQQEFARFCADRDGKTQSEKAAMEQRMLHRYAGK